VTAAVVAGCRPVEPERTREQAPPIAVTTATAVAADLHERLEAGGVVATGQSATIAARILASVQDVRVRAGDRVPAQEVLVTLDARDLAAQTRQSGAATQAAEQALLQARSEQASAAADHKLAAAWHDRIATLLARNSATAQEFDEAEARLAGAAARVAAGCAAVDQAIARLAAARAAADAAAVTESFTVIRAPFAGLVTERLVDPGALAMPGATLIRLEADGARRVDVRVDEARVRYLRPGDRVTVAFDGWGDAEAVDGVVAEVARAVDADQRAFTVKVLLPVAVTQRTGTFARVRFRGEPRRGIVVPAGALRRQGQVTSVFVAEGGVARIRLVQVGGTTEAGTEILAGLDAGEVVVVTPPPGVADGRRISVTAAGGDR
jgi:RND family efflux transporter MFP subunit